MAQPIYKVYMYKPTEAWYQLSEKKKEDYKKRVKAALKKVGGREVISCFSGWNSEQYLGWGVEQFPTVEAAQRYHALLVGMNYFRYVDSNSYLGTEVPKSMF